MGFSSSSDMSSTMEKIVGTFVEIPDQCEPKEVTHINNCEGLCWSTHVKQKSDVPDGGKDVHGHLCY